MKRILKGVTQIKEISTSTAKRVFGVNEEQASKRKSICDKCEFSEKDNVFGGTMCGGAKENEEPCYCNISTFVFSNEKCPLGKWVNI